jgi:hypothetical protein
MNHYAYCLGDPVGAVDPSGLSPSPLCERLSQVAGWVDSLGLFYEFLVGGVGGSISYGPNTLAATNMRNTVGMAIARAEAAEDIARGATHGSGRAYTWHGSPTYDEAQFWSTGWAAVDSYAHPFNGTQVQVGAYHCDWTLNGDGSVKWTIENTLSMNSLLVHEQEILPMLHLKPIKVDHDGGPGGNVQETIGWTEPAP